MVQKTKTHHLYSGKEISFYKWLMLQPLYIEKKKFLLLIIATLFESIKLKKMSRVWTKHLNNHRPLQFKKKR